MGEEGGATSGRSLDALLAEVARSPDVAPTSSLVGETIGRYRIDALLGRGGMGVVYRAHDTKLGRDVALKVLPPQLIGDAERRARFLREARLAASVTHPCTAAIYDAGEEGNAVYVAMELVRGQTLRASLTKGRLPAREAVRIAIELARGLAKAHEAAIVHRDLKPENVMLDEDGNVKILDFGLAKLREAEGNDPATLSTELGRVLGTPAYMSPEQAKGRAVDARSDIFSLGIVLYEMLAGTRPFGGETTVEVLIAIDRDAPAPLAREHASAELARVVERCLEKQPGSRFATARDVADALSAVSAGRRSRWDGRRLGAAAAAIAAVTLAIVGANRARSSAKHEKEEKPTTVSAVAALLGKDDVVFACPVLEATGVEAPAGWLGAATASLVCRRTHWMLGARRGRTLAPAELLALPRVIDDPPHDPYGAPDARERSIDAAKKRGTIYVDGSVTRSESEFRVSLVLRTPAGAEIARGDGAASGIDRAVIMAMRPLGIPMRELDRDVATWLGVDDASLALALDDWSYSVELGTPAEEALRPHASELGVWWPGILMTSAVARGEIADDVAEPAIDRSSPQSLTRTLSSRLLVHFDGAKSDGDELHAILARTQGPFARALVATTEAQIRYASDEPLVAFDVVRAAIEEDPRSPAVWATARFIAQTTPSSQRVGIASTYWNPESPDSWMTAGAGPDVHIDPLLLRRQLAIAPDGPTPAVFGVVPLLVERKREAARSIAARLLRGAPAQRRIGEGISAVVDLTQARFRIADARIRALIADTPLFGPDSIGMNNLFLLMFDACVLAGNARLLGDLVAEKFVLADPPRLFPGAFTAADAAGACEFASPPLAKRCVARLQELLANGYFRLGHLAAAKPHIDALAAHLAGDDRRAAALLRESFDGGRFDMYPYVADVFDDIGDAAFAQKLDDRAIIDYNGATLSDVRTARRALKHGDKKLARERAEKVIAAWSNADVEVAAVAEMRALLARTADKAALP